MTCYDADQLIAMLLAVFVVCTVFVSVCKYLLKD
jgi:hypothetical protein